MLSLVFDPFWNFFPVLASPVMLALLIQLLLGIVHKVETFPLGGDRAYQVYVNAGLVLLLVVETTILNMKKKATVQTKCDWRSL
jgi:hypothetical protein